MTDNHPTQHPYSPPVRPRKWYQQPALWLALALGAVTWGGAAASGTTQSEDTPTALAAEGPRDYRDDRTEPATTDRPATTRPRPTTTTTAAPYVPAVGDFTLTPAITRKQCFGSAGCNVSYTMDVAYNSLEPLDPGTTYAITFEVHGGESVSIDTIELSGDGSYMDRETMASTSNEGAVLSAVVTSVRER